MGLFQWVLRKVKGSDTAKTVPGSEVDVRASHKRSADVTEAEGYGELCI